MPTNILQIIPSLERGGAEKMVLEISKHLKAINDANVLIVTIHPRNEFPEFNNEVNIINCDAVLTPSVFKKPVVDTNELEKIIKNFRPDIIHSHLYEAELLSRWNIIPGIAYISHIHGNYPPLKQLSLKSFFKKKQFANYFERSILLNRYRKCQNHFIAVSNDTVLYLNKNLPEDLHKITLMNNAVDFSKFNRNLKLHEINQAGACKLLTVGSLYEVKNHQFLIDVVEILVKKGYNVNLNIVGYGPLKDFLQETINQKDLTDHIFLKGRIDNIEEIYHRSDIYIHSSKSESFCLSMLEANAAGLPIVCLDGKGNRDILIEGYNGYMLKEPDVNLFAEKIIGLYSDPILYQTNSKNAVDFAKNHDIEKYIEKLWAFYMKILSGTQKDNKVF